ncbi:hypothetical protein KC19_VG267000 [Ceratodon purpureus]|uniref:Uncharacterized protein n=1 Tax=Ceratodon purpureus TaxID=3225 RepID=A0A8T0HVM6_CERPU|nr:hypothetical protein KC19_VG267000 [Ceratodon purpureus]
MKVDMIDNVLNQDILPALEKLCKERAQYMQWTFGNAQLERLKRFCVAYQYTSADQVKNSALSEISDRKVKITEFQEEYLKIKGGVAKIDGMIAAITEVKEKQMSTDFQDFVRDCRQAVQGACESRVGCEQSERQLRSGESNSC